METAQQTKEFEEEDEFDVGKTVEQVIGILLSTVPDRDTVVR